jgi:multisubunit Na+/H+ antiporter MnhC subunit
MDANFIYIIGAVLVAVIFIVIARRVLRLAIKMTLVGFVILALLAGAGYGWWNGWFDSHSQPTRRPVPTRTAAPR